MRAKKVVILAVIGCIGMASSTFATYIDFDDGTPGVAIDGFYSGLGVTFSNAAWYAPISNQTGTPSSGNFLVDVTDSGYNPPFTPQASDPIVGMFSTSQMTVSILAFDVGGNGVTIDAYDSVSGGNLVATESYFGSGAGVGVYLTLSVGAEPNIRRFELYQPTTGANDGIGFDNLSYVIPEPASIGLMCLVSGGIYYARRFFVA